MYLSDCSARAEIFCGNHTEAAGCCVGRHEDQGEGPCRAVSGTAAEAIQRADPSPDSTSDMLRHILMKSHVQLQPRRPTGRTTSEPKKKQRENGGIYHGSVTPC